MIRRERRAAPLLALLVFEVVAIAGLQYSGSSSAMQVPWGDLQTWVDTSTIDQLVMPLLRYMALGLAYWMLASTLLFGAAQLTRIPGAVRAASMFTLPSVRRAVDGAMAVSIATTSVVGFAGAAITADGSSDVSSAAIASLASSMSSGDLTLGGGIIAPSAGGDSVGTPIFGAASVGDSATTTAGDEATTTIDLTTTSTTAADLVTTSTSAAVDQAASDQATTSLAPSAGSDFVPTPRPGAPITTTTTVPQGPSTSATTTPAPAVPTPTVETPTPETPVNATEHRVVPGDNLWTIARDQIAASTNRTGSQVGEAEIRTYWLKVIDVNRDSLRSHDPHWIFPGEIIQLPALDTSAAGS